MMPIDIANFVAQNFKGPDFEGAARLKMYGQESQRRNMLAQMQIDAANEERSQRQALLGIIKSSTGPDGAFDYEGAANAVLQSTGDIDTATKLRSMKGSGTLEKMANALKAADYFRETSIGIKTPEQYQSWWSEVDRASREMGIPNTLPPTYDPAALKAWQTKQAEEYGPVETIPGLGVVQRGPGGEINVLRAEKDRGGDYAPSEMEKSYNFLAGLYGPEKAAEMVGKKYVGEETAPKRERVTDEGTGMNYLVDERGVAQPVVVPTREKRGSRGMGTRDVTRYQPLVTKKLEKPEYRTLNEGDDNESIVSIQGGKASRVELDGEQRGELPDMPPAAEHTGRVVRDTTTNKRYKSDGTKWVEL